MVAGGQFVDAFLEVRMDPTPFYLDYTRPLHIEQSVSISRKGRASSYGVGEMLSTMQNLRGDTHRQGKRPDLQAKLIRQGWE